MGFWIDENGYVKVNKIYFVLYIDKGSSIHILSSYGCLIYIVTGCLVSYRKISLINI